MKRIFFLIALAIFFIGLISPFFVAVRQVKAVVKFCPQITIPGTIIDVEKYGCPPNKKGSISEGYDITKDSIALLAGGAYKFIVGLAAIAAVIVLMAGGYTWLFAGGNSSKVGEAKSLIGSAVLGLFLALGSYMILYLINPELTNLKSLDDIGGIDPITVHGVEKICDANEEAEILKTAEYGCGKVNPTKNCVGITCFASIGALGGGYICSLSSDNKGEFTGGDCVYKISAYKATETISGDSSAPTLSVFEKTSINNNKQDVACGSVKWVTGMTKEVYNDCQPDQWDDKLTTCTIVSQKGQGYPIVREQGGEDVVYTKYNKKFIQMSCRSALRAQIK
ncbi:hypothetical protein EPN15_03690 [Patescibacteria group bacterium]|nr:MAG: hypothetical protein EPN15_03690 [Patescibacteria group bacterium]